MILTVTLTLTDTVMLLSQTKLGSELLLERWPLVELTDRELLIVDAVLIKYFILLK